MTIELYRYFEDLNHGSQLKSTRKKTIYGWALGKPWVHCHMKIDSPPWRRLLATAAGDLQVGLTADMVGQFVQYGLLLQRWNRKMNLTAIRDPAEIAIKHFVDSLAAVPLLKTGACLLDLGSGAGFPGLCLKIARPDLAITLVDGIHKRITFLKYVIGRLGLDGIRAEHTRIESLADGRRKCYAVIVTRAVASLKEFAILAGPHLVPGGRLIAWKGNHYQAELDELKAEGACQDPDTRVWRPCIVPYHLVQPDLTRYLVVLEDRT